MKKYIFYILLALSALAGCQQEHKLHPENTVKGEGILYAEIDDEGLTTRTYLDKDLNTLWQKGDQITAFIRTAQRKTFELKEADAGKTSGQFLLINSGEDSHPHVDIETDVTIAGYPRNDKLSIKLIMAEKRMELQNIELPATQQYDPAHTIAQNSLPMAAFSMGDENRITFKNLCGILELKLTGTGKVASIELKGNNGEALCGTASMRFEEFPKFTLSADAGKVLVLDCGKEGVALNSTEPVSFMLALPPMTFEKGFEITVTDTDGFVMQHRTDKKVTVNRSRILPMAALDFVPTHGTFTVNGVSFEMLKVEKGSFMMGATEEQSTLGFTPTDLEYPVHKVTLTKDFYIGKFEVTQDLWQAVMGSNPSDNKGDKIPVNNITQETIINDFLPKLKELTGKDFNLPTEAQWEYAARGGNKSRHFIFSGSNDLDEVGWYGTTNRLKEVGLKKPNELGLYDMSGNVEERCLDCYRPYTADNQTDPCFSGPASSEHITRGGAAMLWYYPTHCRNSIRGQYPYKNRNPFIGFRLVFNVQ